MPDSYDQREDLYRLQKQRDNSSSNSPPCAVVGCYIPHPHRHADTTLFPTTRIVGNAVLSERAYDEGYENGWKGERATIVAWLRTDRGISYGDAVRRDAADMIERGEHGLIDSHEAMWPVVEAALLHRDVGDCALDACHACMAVDRYRKAQRER